MSEHNKSLIKKLFEGSKRISKRLHSLLMYSWRFYSWGKNVLIAGRGYITDHDHVFNIPNVAPLHAGWEVKPVIIEDGIWIGEGASMLKGVRVGKRAVVGANGVVTKDFPSYTVVGGVPATIIKNIRLQS